jgi:hypothetical protein
MKIINYTGVILLLLAASSQFSEACPSCYGAADSPMTAGMNTAILVMLGIIGFVLVTISTAFILLWRRYKKLKNSLSNEMYINEQGTLQTKNEKGVVEWNNF